SMPDKWEYPWYAAWDLAFHVIALSLVDEDFGKQQLDLMLREPYLHPSGQIPAYEWNFGDVLRLPDGRAERLKVRSMVGLLPLCAVTVFGGTTLEDYPDIRQRLLSFVEGRPELLAFIHDPLKRGQGGPAARRRPGRDQAPPGPGDDARRE